MAESTRPRPRSRGRPAPAAVPTDADPADHAELVAPHLLPRTHRRWDDYSDGRSECERHGLTLVLRPDGAKWSLEVREGDTEVANYSGFVSRPEASVAAALFAEGYRLGKGGGS